MTLSIASADASTPEPTYGMPSSSSIPWIVPSSPHWPWMAMKATSIGRPAPAAVPESDGTSAVVADCSSAAASEDLRLEPGRQLAPVALGKLLDDAGVGRQGARVDALVVGESRVAAHQGERIDEHHVIAVARKLRCDLDAGRERDGTLRRCAARENAHTDPRRCHCVLPARPVTGKHDLEDELDAAFRDGRSRVRTQPSCRTSLAVPF